MKPILRHLFFVLLLSGAAFAGAQQSPLEQGSAFFQNAWKRVQAEGPAAAEKLIRSTPERFRRVKGQVGDLTKDVQVWARDRKLEEKKNLALELWRVRGSLDLMALLNPDILEQLTGIDGKTLRSLRSQVEKAQGLLARGR